MIQYTLIFLSASLVLCASPCELQIVSARNSADTYTLVLKHGMQCEILMDHNTSHISLISKIKDKNVSTAKVDEHVNTLNDKVEKIITLAKSKLGYSYESAKAGPNHFDCSGFVYYVFKNNGINIPRSSLPQSQSGKQLTREDIQRGDILFFDTHNRKHVNHSGIYLGKGKFIHSSSGTVYAVTISELDKGFYKDKFCWGVRKIDK
jgi:cell wall-associated NlpC family hydrolase